MVDHSLRSSFRSYRATVSEMRDYRTLSLVVTQSCLQGSVGATAPGRTVCGAAVERDLAPRRTKKVRKGPGPTCTISVTAVFSLQLPAEMTRTFQLLSKLVPAIPERLKFSGKVRHASNLTNLCAREGPASTSATPVFCCSPL